MGNLFSAITRVITMKKEQRILMIGLDNAGKTSILYHLKFGQPVTTIPTIGFNVEDLQYRNIHFTVWDVGGQERLRVLWRHYYSGANGIIFVVDSADTERIKEAKNELNKILSEELLKDKSILIFANKQDLSNKLEPSELAAKLGLQDNENLRNRKWCIQPCTAITTTGLFEGLNWLAKSMLES